MSKKKSKKPKFGKNNINIFDKFDSNRNKVTHFDKKNNKSKFIKKFKNLDIIYDYTSKKNKKLKLYNLNESFILTHKNKPIEENYESDIEESSEEDFNNKKDFTNISEIYKEYKDLKEKSKKDKEEQKILLSKLDKEFEELDLSEFYKPSKNIVEYYSIKENPKEPDEFDSNLKEFQLNFNLPEPSSDLVKEYKSVVKISERFEVIESIIKSQSSFHNFAENFVSGYLDCFENYLEEEDLSNFTLYLDTFSRGFSYLSNKTPQEYKSYLESELLKLNSYLENRNTKEGVREYLLLYLVVKTVELNSELGKHTLLLIEVYLTNLYRKLLELSKPLSRKDSVLTKLLLLVCYNCIIEGEYYVPYFYHVGFRACFMSIEKNFILSILKIVKITFNLLLSKDCKINFVINSVILPCLDEIESNLVKSGSYSIDNTLQEKTDIQGEEEEFTQFKEYIHDLFQIKYTPKSLDIYNKPAVKSEYPKLKGDKLPKSERISEKKIEFRKKAEKSEYKSLKRALLSETLKKAELTTRKRAKHRVDSERRYKEVIRKAMIEQETLKKLSTSSIL